MKKFIKTVGLTESQIQEIRLGYLGASEIGVILGLNPFRTPHNIWREKRRDPNYQRFQGNEFTKWGTRLEDSIGKGFATDYFCTIKKDNKIRVHENGFLSCSLDRLITIQKGIERPGLGILEIKNISQYAYDKFRKTETEIPLHYYAQHQQQFLITGYKWGYFVMLVGGNKLEVKEMIPDITFMKALQNYAEEYWNTHIIQGQEPPLTAPDIQNPQETQLKEGEYINFDDMETFQLYQNYQDINSEIKEREKVRDSYKEKLIEKIGTFKQLTFQKHPLMEWGEYRIFDSKSFQKDHPEDYAAYKKNIIRKLTFKKYIYEAEK